MAFLELKIVFLCKLPIIGSFFACFPSDINFIVVSFFVYLEMAN